jgi:hypothetical protein
MNIVEQIKSYMAAPSPDEDGEDRGTRLLPPLSADEIATMERSFGCAFTPEVKALLEFCGGFEEGPMEIIEFKGEVADYLMPALNGRFYCIAPDGFGNFWFHWASCVNARLGPVYYYQHEGPMLMYQSDGIEAFVSECLRFMRPPYASLIDDVHEFRLRRTSTFNDDLKSRDAIRDARSDLADFVAGFDEDVSFYDFRGAKPGDGVDLAKLNVIALHPDLPVLAVKKRKTLAGRIASLFGRDR